MSHPASAVTYARCVADHDPGSGDDDVVINAIYALEDEGEYVLVLVEEAAWGAEVIADVADRINRCVDYVLDGEMAAQFPESAGHRIRIHVDHLEPVDADASAFFLLVAERLAERGIAFSHNLLGGPERPSRQV
jgi:hypothetical protein